MVDESDENEGPPILRFTYQKGTYYRVIKADGAWGNMTPRGEILMSIFVERPPVPDYEEYSLDVDEKTVSSSPVKRVTKTKGLIREIEVALALRPEVALSMGRWLISKAKAFEEAAGISIEDDPIDTSEFSRIKPKEKK
ncbi:MAG: hypothetical protein WBD16_14775 [Pyrinomonadaceae bacterium]